ncbi:DNA topoisomerase I [Candidatus Wolfebacteria bacterium RIFOXYD12_FULL_48_21]|uniref:DNA topoisomerase 1 n=1 Tax=Candidatus Wolfebacteria bacterium RIFOXYD1_FULL_48_65 TaxID=1802561 RepID=A0A1F8E033_9BACT|nr:MAG: DNA topoisomerase I [Candidatus Wolfebacteria bacterium RIFOXYD1_FULL_48_65]OGM95166.1 MAG: DNA topoisomerase I [Candidatus Wolfebacteria bacterium RIFOXYD12_FULL_48_21]
MKLVIVESPTKAKTISKFLGKGYQVESSFGHIRDLPKSKLAIDIEHNFEPSYIIPVKAKKRVTQLKKDAAKADVVILASDEDREGEAIAYHLTEALKLKDRPASEVQRITFHEITQTAIEEALKHPRAINEALVHAQQARRVLDRLVGYKLSPFLWEKVMKRLSAGRVQSVALRLICDREEEIKKFIAEEYWTMSALFVKKGSEISMEANLVAVNEKTLGKFDIPTEAAAHILEDQLSTSIFSVAKIEARESKKNPLAPFTTSTLQQEGSKKLRFSAKQTMAIAQGLYEKGLITYMRTDSVNLSKESLDGAKKWILENLGEQYATDTPRAFKTKSKLAQEAHEAIRPTNPALSPELFAINDDPKAKKLYELIWRRFMASQLPQAVFKTTSIEIKGINAAAHKTFGLRASGTVTVFDGFQKIMPTSGEEKIMPALQEGEPMHAEKIMPIQHFTEPPARYDEAGLIKVLEEHGIGRPSTYAPTISTIQTRNYVEKTDQRRFKPTEIGEAVNTMLVAHFPQIVDVEFTAKMEDEFDEVAEGHKQWQEVIRAFYGPFEKNLEQKMKEVPKIERALEVSDELCALCGKQMLIKYSRFGKFLACSGFPECRNTKKILTEEEKALGKCPKCNQGDIVKKKSKRGRSFYGCSRYPDCDWASWKKPESKEEEEVETTE